jgi:hypothetical protein
MGEMIRVVNGQRVAILRLFGPEMKALPFF